MMYEPVKCTAIPHDKETVTTCKYINDADLAKADCNCHTLLLLLTTKYSTYQYSIT